MKRIYLDNAATTKVREEVVRAMLPYFSEVYGNPSSVHAFGQDARAAVDHARGQVANSLGAQPNEIYFTGSGTEADNWAIKGYAMKQKAKGNHIISSSIEHHAVLHTCQWLEKQGFEVTYLPVDEEGIVQPETLENAMTDRTTLVTVMYANNEIGTIQPIERLCEITHARGAAFHTDAVQAVGAIPIDLAKLPVDMLSLSAHKFHGPKGVGALYIRKGTRLEARTHGGAQERGQRAGTENLPSIVGMGEAIALAVSRLPEHSAYLTHLRDRLIDGILALIPEVRLNGHRTERLPGNVNVSVRYIEGESLLLSLDLQGIAASSGSACTSGSLDPSHVLLAIGLPHEIAHGSLRLSLSDFNTPHEVDEVLDKLPKIVDRLRSMSPLWAKG